jgi:hypothetical protein
MGANSRGKWGFKRQSADRELRMALNSRLDLKQHWCDLQLFDVSRE